MTCTFHPIVRLTVYALQCQLHFYYKSEMCKITIFTSMFSMTQMVKCFYVLYLEQQSIMSELATGLLRNDQTLFMICLLFSICFLIRGVSKKMPRYSNSCIYAIRRVYRMLSQFSCITPNQYMRSGYSFLLSISRERTMNKIGPERVQTCRIMCFWFENTDKY